VGRRRLSDKHLPRRVYHRHGAYFYAAPDGRWHRLAADYPAALRTLATMVKSDNPPVTVDTLIAKYEVDVLAKQAERTRQTRAQEFRQVRAVFGKMHPADIEPSDVFRFWLDRGQIEQAKHEIRALSAVMTFGRNIGAYKHPNPCFGLRLPESKARERYVTDAEFLLARDRAPAMIGHAMDLALVGGLDQGTIRQLERRHITDAGLRFTRGKTGEEQLIDWNDELRLVVAAALRESPQVRRFVICTRRGQPFSLSGFQSAWQRLMAKVEQDGGTKFTFHDLRAKSASDSDSDEEARARLGHQDVRTTVRHYRRLPKRATALRILDKPADIGQG
jgi:integrase